MDKIKKVANASKKFVDDHKIGITITLTALTCLMVNRYALSGHDDFLKEKGLYDEFYTPTDEEMGV